MFGLGFVLSYNHGREVREVRDSLQAEAVVAKSDALQPDSTVRVCDMCERSGFRPIFEHVRRSCPCSVNSEYVADRIGQTNACFRCSLADELNFKRSDEENHIVDEQLKSIRCDSTVSGGCDMKCDLYELA